MLFWFVGFHIFTYPFTLLLLRRERNITHVCCILSKWPQLCRTNLSKSQVEYEIKMNVAWFWTAFLLLVLSYKTQSANLKTLGTWLLLIKSSLYSYIFGNLLRDLRWSHWKASANYEDHWSGRVRACRYLFFVFYADRYWQFKRDNSHRWSPCKQSV